MKPKIIKKPAIKLAGFVSKINELNTMNLTVKDLTTKLWDDCINSGSLEKLNNESFIKNHNQFGICIPVNPGTHEFEYFIGFEVKRSSDIPKEYHACTIPEALYAIFKTPPVERTKIAATIDNTYLSIHLDWLPTSGYIYLEDKADFCYYDMRDDKVDSRACDIYIPIAKIKRDKSSKSTNTNTKKCTNCSRSISAHYYRCPHCRTENFEFDN